MQQNRSLAPATVVAVRTNLPAYVAAVRFGRLLSSGACVVEQVPNTGLHVQLDRAVRFSAAITASLNVIGNAGELGVEVMTLHAAAAGEAGAPARCRGSASANASSSAAARGLLQARGMLAVVDDYLHTWELLLRPVCCEWCLWSRFLAAHSTSPPRSVVAQAAHDTFERLPLRPLAGAGIVSGEAGLPARPAVAQPPPT